MTGRFWQGRKGFLAVSLEQYVELLDWTGRQLREAKRDSIPQYLAPILERIGLIRIRGASWFKNLAGFSNGRPVLLIRLLRKQNVAAKIICKPPVRPSLPATADRCGRFD